MLFVGLGALEGDVVEPICSENVAEYDMSLVMRVALSTLSGHSALEAASETRCLLVGEDGRKVGVVHGGIASSAMMSQMAESTLSASVDAASQALTVSLSQPSIQ
jgi:hypothetical protein